jgi:plasmid stabilization system protein ParE
VSFPTKILPDARLDIIGAIAWYNEQQAGLGKRFRDTLTEAIHLIRDQPLLFAERYRAVCLAPLKKFPYLVYYVFDEPSHRVIIIAVLHGGRNPEVWKERV